MILLTLIYANTKIYTQGRVIINITFPHRLVHHELPYSWSKLGRFYPQMQLLVSALHIYISYLSPRNLCSNFYWNLHVSFHTVAYSESPFPCTSHSENMHYWYSLSYLKANVSSIIYLRFSAKQCSKQCTLNCVLNANAGKKGTYPQESSSAHVLPRKSSSKHMCQKAMLTWTRN